MVDVVGLRHAFFCCSCSYVADLSAWARRTRHLPWVSHIADGQETKLEPVKGRVIESQQRRIRFLENEVRRLSASTSETGRRRRGNNHDDIHGDEDDDERSLSSVRSRSPAQNAKRGDPDFGKFIRSRERQNPNLRSVRSVGGADDQAVRGRSRQGERHGNSSTSHGSKKKQRSGSSFPAITN